MKHFATFLTLVVVMGLAWIATTAQCQYGNPNDPYLDYQRIERERESLELQRRQVEAIERQELDRHMFPTVVDPYDPAYVGQGVNHDY